MGLNFPVLHHRGFSPSSLSLSTSIVYWTVEYPEYVLDHSENLISSSMLHTIYHSVLNAAAELVFSARKSEHITLLLCELHWLRVPERIKFGSVFWLSDAFMVQCHGTSPRPCIWQPAAVPAVVCALLPSRNWSFQLHDDRPWEIVRFQLQLPGTLCHLSSEMNSHWRPFDSNWRRYFSVAWLFNVC